MTVTQPQNNFETPEFTGPTYEEFNEPTEDIITSIKQASKRFLETETIVADLTEKVANLEAQSITKKHDEAVKDFVKRAFPQVTTAIEAMNLINYLIITDQAQPYGWFNQTTHYKPENKLEMLKAIIELSNEAGESE